MDLYISASQNENLDTANRTFTQDKSYIDDEKPKKNKNDIKWLKNIRQFEKYEFDLDSPRFLQACVNLGVSINECKKKKKEDFYQKGIDQDLIQLRYKHYCARAIETINNVLQERRNIKMKQLQKLLFQQKMDQGGRSQLKRLPTFSKSQSNFNQRNNQMMSQTYIATARSKAPNTGSQQFQELINQVGQAKTTLFTQRSGSLRGIPHNIKFLFTKSQFRETLQSQQDHSDLPQLNQTQFKQNVSIQKPLHQSKRSLSPIIKEKLKFDKEEIIMQLMRKREKYENGKCLIEKKHQLIKESDQKLYKISENVKKKIQESTENKKNINDQKKQQVLERIQKIQLEYEKDIKNEQEKQVQNMNQTFYKQMEVEREKRRQLIEREESFQRKLNEINQQKKEREEYEDQCRMELLEKIENKMSQGKKKHETIIKKYQNKINQKSESDLQKINQFKQQLQEKQNFDNTKRQSQEKQLKKQLQKQYEIQTEQLEMYKQKNQDKLDLFKVNKKKEEFKEMQKLSQKTQKQETAEVLKEQQRQAQLKDFSLRNEMRKLRNQDIKLLRDRQKRLYELKKDQIMKKNIEQSQFIEEIRNSEERIKLNKLNLMKYDI